MSKRNPIVLCVDDETNVLRSMRRDLRDEPIEVLLVGGGREALDKLINTEVAVVVSDMKMPEMTGADFLSQVREIWPDAYRILLTGYADLETVTSAVNQGGIHRYLTKPWDKEILRSAVREGVDWNRLLKENARLQSELAKRNDELERLNESLEQKVLDRTKELEVAHRELSQSEKLSTVGRLAAGVVHEALTPLTVAVASIDLAQMDGQLTDKTSNQLEMAQEGVQQAVRIMDNLRDFSRQGGRVRGSVDIGERLQRTAELLKFEAVKRKIELQVNCSSNATVLGDRDRLGQVFLNLAKNAIEAMAPGGVVSLGCAQNGGDGKWVAAYVRDTGPGIPGEILEHLWEPFRTTKEEGTGLGLSICKEIVEAHGGEIRVDSDAGQGTRFTIILPLAVRN